MTRLEVVFHFANLPLEGKILLLLLLHISLPDACSVFYSADSTRVTSDHPRGTDVCFVCLCVCVCVCVVLCRQKSEMSRSLVQGFQITSTNKIKDLRNRKDSGYIGL
jgi:hypothetical protein